MLTRLEKVSPFSKFPILGNRFLLLRLRGKGGNGEVWDVVDYANNKQLCALKLSTSIRHAQREHHTHSVRIALFKSVLWELRLTVLLIFNRNSTTPTSSRLVRCLSSSATSNSSTLLSL